MPRAPRPIVILSIFNNWFARRLRPVPSGSHSALKVALVSDELTHSCIGHECRVIDLTPSNMATVLRRDRPDLVFVESAWSGHRQTWRYRIAAYPDHPDRRNDAIVDLTRLARELGIPTVFWNKEDAVHFERFVDSARHFDVILTIDSTCIDRYRKVARPGVAIEALPFAVQPALHHFTGIAGDRRGADFVGSYSRHIHDARRRRQDMLLRTSAARLGLTVYDRNSDRRSADYRYPDFPGLRVRPKQPHDRTGAIYKRHLASLNVNTVEDSDTMYSRRLVEILACGGLAVSTPARSIERWFKDYCHVVDSDDEADDLFSRLARDGYSARDRDMMKSGAEYVLKHHTWSQRLDAMLDAVSRSRSTSG